FNQAQYSHSSVKRYTGIAGQGDADIKQSNISNETRLVFGDQHSEFSGVSGVYVARTKSDESLLLSGLSSFDDTKEN
ncbi:hypothetical protein LI321_23135, partial [Lacrimispora saccharolytica]|nr:hypothetical protein [Lacrimispora saccharolytica]